jgi:hypothetical protein
MPQPATVAPTIGSVRRYSSFLLVTVFALISATGMAWADGSPQQRRAALRAELKAQREADQQKDDRPARQLSPAEREKLREQLREQLRQQRKEALQQRQTSGK